MTLRKSGLFLVGALLFVGTGAGAEEFASDMSVAREMVSREGHRFLFTVTPPKGRSVDSRIFDLFEIDEGDGNAGGQAMTVEAARKHKVSEPEEVEALDLSDYTIGIAPVALANTCSIKTAVVKYKKSSLSKGRAVRVDATGAASIYVGVYPIQGDVDAYTSFGPNDTLCNQSIKDAGQFDLAKCFDSTCNPSGNVLSGLVVNPLSSTAQWVGAVTVTFSR